MKVLEETDSPINGPIRVVKDIAWGKHIQVGGLTQSGGIERSVWRKGLREIKKLGLKVDNCLILGLGGGGAVRVIKKFWPEAKITGVDVDPKMVSLGKKYLEMDESEVDIVLMDAGDFVENQITKKKHFDMILVDIYVGDKVPQKFDTLKFFRAVKSLLSKDGLVIFNRLYYKEKKAEANVLFSKLKKVFSKTSLIFPEANILFVSSN